MIFLSSSFCQVVTKLLTKLLIEIGARRVPPENFKQNQNLVTLGRNNSSGNIVRWKEKTTYRKPSIEHVMYVGSARTIGFVVRNFTKSFRITILKISMVYSARAMRFCRSLSQTQTCRKLQALGERGVVQSC